MAICCPWGRCTLRQQSVQSKLSQSFVKVITKLSQGASKKLWPVVDQRNIFGLHKKSGIDPSPPSVGKIPHLVNIHKEVGLCQKEPLWEIFPLNHTFPKSVASNLFFIFFFEGPNNHYMEWLCQTSIHTKIRRSLDICFPCL